MISSVKNKRWKYLKEIWPYIKKDFPALILIFFAKLGNTITLLISPLIYRYFINDVVIQGNVERLFIVIGGYFGLFIFQSLFSMVYSFFDNKLKNLLRIKLKSKLLSFYTSMSMQEYDSINKGDIRNVIEEDTVKIQELFSESVNYIFGILTIISLIVVMIIMDWRLTLFGILMMLCSFFLTQVVGEKIKKVASQYRKGLGELEEVIHDSLLNWKEIKVNALEERAAEEMLLKWNEIAAFTIKRTFYQYIAVVLSVVNLMMITRASIYFFGGILIFRKMTTVATMLIFINYYQQLNREMTDITDLAIKFKGDEPQIENVISILKEKNLKKPFGQINGEMRLDHVNFKYTEISPIILDNICMTIPQNSHIAIVGKSGSGKSTLAKLMLGLLRPTSGSIFVGGTDISQVSEQGLMRTISAVMQEPLFFNMSIAENLRIAKCDAAEAEMDDACRQANIYDFIQMLPEKYDTVIGERGIKLSGGQRQRLAIARILLKDPDMIIFDEATSSLDTENEMAIIQAIQNISRDKTIITIAHRFATIRGSDYIYMIQDGEIVVEGITSRIIANSNEIANLFQLSEQG